MVGPLTQLKGYHPYSHTPVVTHKQCTLAHYAAVQLRHFWWFQRRQEFELCVPTAVQYSEQVYELAYFSWSAPVFFFTPNLRYGQLEGGWRKRWGIRRAALQQIWESGERRGGAGGIKHASWIKRYVSGAMCSIPLVT